VNLRLPVLFVVMILVTMLPAIKPVMAHEIHEGQYCDHYAPATCPAGCVHCKELPAPWDYCNYLALDVMYLCEPTEEDLSCETWWEYCSSFATCGATCHWCHADLGFLLGNTCW